MPDDFPRMKAIRRLVGRAIGEHRLIVDGDRIAVGLSGGKDSWTLLFVLEELRRRAPVKFELLPVTIDSGFPGFEARRIGDYLASRGFSHILRRSDLYRIIESQTDRRDSRCVFCARMRRGSLSSAAREAACNKIALGHHLDDFAETLLLNLFYSGTTAAMPAIYREESGSEVIRPLLHVPEEMIREFIADTDAPVIPCACPGSSETDQKRQTMKRLLQKLNEEIPGLKHSLDTALGNLRPERFPGIKNTASKTSTRV